MNRPRFAETDLSGEIGHNVTVERHTTEVVTIARCDDGNPQAVRALRQASPDRLTVLS